MTSYPIPDGPHNDPWKSLLPLCFAVVDEVVREHGIEFPIRIGGGSMLLRRYGHRRSKDLDLFVTDIRLLRWCSPRMNEAAADLFPDYGEEATAVKLITGLQEIDIIAAAPILAEDDVEPAFFSGRPVLIERPREILAKKIVYRGRLFQPRDVFDLACVAAAEPEEVAAILPWLSPTHLDDLDARLTEIEPMLATDLPRKVEAFPAFSPLVENCLAVARGVVATWREAMTPKVIAPPYPKRTHRAVYSKDGLTVVIKEWDAATGRFDRIGNPLGPAIIGPEGASYAIGGMPLTEQAWVDHPRVREAQGARQQEDR